MTNEQTVLIRHRKRLHHTRLIVLCLIAAVALVARGDDEELNSLLARFEGASYFFTQFDVAQEIVKHGDKRALPRLASLLESKDRHVRGNAAFIFAKFGDPRGLATIEDILQDFSADRHVEFWGIELLVPSNETAEEATAKFLRSSAGVKQQIEADRFYAVHLLGVLGDRRAIPLLRPLLTDPDIGDKVRWALEEIRHEGHGRR